MFDKFIKEQNIHVQNIWVCHDLKGNVRTVDLEQLLEDYHKAKVKNISSNLPVIGSAICDAIDANQVQKVDRHVGMFLEIGEALKLHLL